MPTFDRNQFIRVAWQAKLAGHITPTAYLIGRAMLRRACRKGSLWPSKATIASDVGCCERTVARALSSLSALGLLGWQRRPGRHRRYATNLYTLACPSPTNAFGAGQRWVRENRLERQKRRLKKQIEQVFESSSAKMSDGFRQPRPEISGQPSLALDWSPPAARNPKTHAAMLAAIRAARADRASTP